MKFIGAGASRHHILPDELNFDVYMDDRDYYGGGAILPEDMIDPSFIAYMEGIGHQYGLGSGVNSWRCYVDDQNYLVYILIFKDYKAYQYVEAI